MKRCFELKENCWIGDGHPCFIIAEIGQNHQGDIEVAKKLINVAKESGADCVKFQKSDLQAKFTQSVLDRKYESPHAFGKTYGEHKQYLEFSADQYKELLNYANSLGIMFTCSAMDESSLEFLVQLGVPFIKIGSGDANNLLILEKASKAKLPIFYSTGMQDLDTVVKAMTLMARHNSKICIMQCTSAYPTPDDEIHLRVMETFKDLFPGSPVGYSGHELGLAVTFAAVALGAHVVERHITLDKTSKGNDHACSLDPSELKALVTGIRRIEMALGSPHKSKQPSEEPCHQKLGKSVVFARQLEAGCKIHRDDLAVKVGQPVGWPPQNLNQLIGLVLAKNVDVDETVTLECVLLPN